MDNSTAGGSVLFNMFLTAKAESAKAIQRGKVMLANDKAKYKHVAQQLDFSTQAYGNNFAAIDRARVDNDIKIEKQELTAKDKMLQTFAGSGIKGTSVDEIDSQITSGAETAHTKNALKSYEEEDANTLAILRGNRKAKDQINSSVIFNADAEEMNIGLATVETGVSTAINNMSKMG